MHLENPVSRTTSNISTAIFPLVALAAIIVITFATSASAMFMRPNDAPADRLIRNIKAYIKENPKDPQGYYTLGR
ncbi:MAG: hypothetical protein MI741_15580, partial [Rhodospirillales bacterium]|nr:hypothetical protein [Rhodospirillales bacterium]